MIHLLLIFIGFALLIKGADWMVSGSSSLAKKHNISELAIGLTIVAFGTSAPELVVNSMASMDNQSDIVFGNIIGSNNFNLFVILGTAGLIFPITVQSTTVWKEIPLSLMAVVLMSLLVGAFMAFDTHVLSRLDGFVLLSFFAMFLYYVFRQLKTETVEIETSEVIPSNLKIWTLIAVGLACLVLGGKLVVTNAIEIATDFGVSKKIIGLTIVAAGTSLPELMTSVVAALKRNSDIAIGNVIGSNIFNILLILSVSSFIHPIDYNLSFNRDVLLLIGGTIFLFVAMFTGQKKKLDRWEAAILLVTFVAYTIYLIKDEL